ncbi:molybdopterin molybdotransferase MoeA [Ornithinibacillus gellani]|uniref:molybdopterin molybdotransferase MoeA n=1 Tax=Ornithinibacillus gellani TaxID=2293253 RepID=UPI000F49AF5F|nr:gephyrin-like molybdotransferase Glp [Ornithinibacillus gellani]TQS75732.1 molybdopterin molybdotransferase MoeA [Ornithinibacillus gellani]
MLERRHPIPVEEAVELVMQHRKAGSKETISITDSYDRSIAEPIIATEPIPSFDKSPYDGFALRSNDIKSASRDNPIRLEVIEHIGAGQVPQKEIGENQATRIMTGAQIPNGADCIAMFEICQTIETDGKDFIEIKRSLSKGENIIQEGSEVQKGSILVKPGTVINPGVKALLATFGHAELAVAKKPVVGILATGSELLEVHEPLEPGKIRNSNASMVAAQILRAGGEYRYFGKLSDTFDPSYQAMIAALDEVDYLITTGGVSVGDFDLMPDLYQKLEAKVLFNKIQMRPGSVTTVAVMGEKLLFGLSGNPSACYVGFELFVRPIMQYALYHSQPYLRSIRAELAVDFPKANPFTRFVRSMLDYEDGKMKVNLAGIDKSNVVSSLANTDSLMILPGGTRGFRKGTMVDVLLLNDKAGQEHFEVPHKRSNKG